MKIVCIGNIAYDITIPLESYPIENTKNRVKSRVECGGGPASNAAYLLGKWGMDASIVGVIGCDEYGKTIKQEFESVNVNTKYLEENADHKTTSSLIIANTSIGSRTVLTYKPKEIKCKDINLDFEPDIILVDGQEYELSKKIIEEYPKAISIIDAGSARDEVIKLSEMVNYVICSKNFAEDVTGIKVNYDDNNSLIDLYKKLTTMYKGHIVVTLESHGALYKYDGKIKVMPSLKMKAVDSTGAGDIFHGAFTYGISKNMNYEDIIKISNIAGALSVTKIGGRYSIPTKEEMKKVYNEFE